MGSEEHDASSSSPSDSLTILDAEEGTARARTKVLLSDGSSFFVRTRMWADTGLSVGDSIDPGHMAAIELESDIADSVDYAVGLLARREHSRAEMSRKLTRKGFGDAVVRHSLDRLESDGLQSDLRFATLFIEQRMARRPEAENAVRARLIRRGVDDAVIAEAIAAVRSSTPELLDNAPRAAAEKLVAKSGMTDEKLARSLARRGFRLPDIIAAMRAVGRSGEIFTKNGNLS